MSAKQIKEVPRPFRSIVASGNMKMLTKKVRADYTDVASIKKIIAILLIPKLSMPGFPKRPTLLKDFQKHLKRVKKYKKHKKNKKLEKIKTRSKVEEMGPKEIMELPRVFRSIVASGNLKMLTNKLELDNTDRKSLKKAILILSMKNMVLPGFPRKAELCKSFLKQLKRLRGRRKRKKLKKLRKLEKLKEKEALEKPEDKATDEKAVEAPTSTKQEESAATEKPKEEEAVEKTEENATVEKAVEAPIPSKPEESATTEKPQEEETIEKTEETATIEVEK